MSALEKTASVAPATSQSTEKSPRTGDDKIPPFKDAIVLSPSSMGKFFGRGGEAFRKYVTGKSAFAVKKAYTDDYKKLLKVVDGNQDDESIRPLTPPDELGSILISVKFPPSNDLDEHSSQIPYTAQIINDKENLSKYMPIVKANLDKHAASCSVKKDPLDRFTHKIVFVAEIDHEGQIGKFIGQGGKNIKHLTNQVIDSLGTSQVRISMVPSSGFEMKRPPWMNKYIRLETDSNSNFEVYIIVAANILGGREADYRKTMRVLTPIISQSVLKLQKVKESSEVMASEFLDDFGSQYMPGCTDYPNDNW